MTRPIWRWPYWDVPSPLAHDLAAIVGADHVLDRRRRARRLRGRLDGSVPGPGGRRRAPRPTRRGRRRAGVVRRARRGPSCPRAATPAWSAAACRRRRRGRAVAAPPRRARPGRRARRPGHRRRRRHPRGAAAHAAGSRLGLRRRPRGPRTAPRSAAWWPPTPAASTCCATGRCGPRCSGVEAVLADGAVVRHLDGLVKDNTGYDLAGLLCGSEGTLGVVTAARLRLVPARPTGCVALVGRADAWPRRWRWRPSCGRTVPTGSTPSRRCSATGSPSCVRRSCGLPAPLAGGSRRRRCWSEWAGDGRSARGAAPTPSARLDAVGGGRRRRPARARLWRYREGHRGHRHARACPTSSTSPCRAAALAAFADDVPAGDRRRRPRRPGPTCSGTSATATSTST